MALSDSTIQHINETVQWYNWHRSMLENASPEKQNQFLLQGFNCLLKAMVEIAEDVNNGDQPQIVLPKGLSLDESLRG